MTSRTTVRLALAAALTTNLAAFPAGAQSPEEFATRLLGREPGAGSTYACFLRRYDLAHLAAHPHQNVGSMNVLTVFKRDPTDASAAPQYDLRIGVRFRDDRRLSEIEGDCRALGAKGDAKGPVSIHCSVACDGGSIDLALKDNGSILVGIPAGARTSTPGVVEDETSDGPKKLHGGFGADDKLFRVNRADIRQCLELGEDKAEKTKMLRQ
jgi:hypothetical protein